MTGSDAFYRAAERRIEWLTLGLGAAAAVVVAVRWGWRAALGLAVGAALAWLNYRWLKQGVGALVQLSVAQADAPKVRIPRRVYLKSFGRIALLIAVVYAILSRSLLPGAAVLAGLFSLVAAVLVELLYQLFRSGAQTDAG